jgi:folate-dependent phosphoribosylglycinamide formyltransferase PurN
VPVRIGLLLDSFHVPAWQRTIVENIIRNPEVKLILVILNQSQEKPNTTNRWVYRLLRKTDRLVFKSAHNQFIRTDLSSTLQGTDTLKVTPAQTRFKDQFNKEDIDWIRTRQPDILIRFGFRILTGDILTVAKHGVWSLHHGDSAVNRGGPPAFWEVVNGDLITGVTLQILSEKLDAGIVLGKAFCKTDRTSFTRNQNSVYAAGNELFMSRLKDFASMGPDKFFKALKRDDTFFAKTLYRDPTNGKALIIALSFWCRRMKELLIQFFFIEQWFIFYHRKPDYPFYFKDASVIPSPELADWADPFVFHHQGYDYVFFEALARSNRRGEIKCFRMDQLKAAPIRVLEEDHHLSYPTITEYQNKLYLLTESAAAKTVDLYECIEFPHQWKKRRPLLNGVELYDPTLFHHEGMWYLFGTQKPVTGASPDMYLHIYYVTELLNGEWQPHPRNPITRDVRGSRPAGKIFNFRGKLVRPAQIGTPKYGFGVRFMEITKLTTTEFEEVAVDDMVPWQSSLLATHTYSATPDLFVTDGQVRRFRFF